MSVHFFSMVLTPYQILAPSLSLFAVFYAWSLFFRQKKTLWEAVLWSVFWVVIALVALFPSMLTYLTFFTGIKDQANAFLVTFLGILSFIIFYLIVRLEELEQRQTRIVRAMALKDFEKETEKKTPQSI